ncbi:MAG: pitrilysin family protein, partial [Candidatus Omnitrophota bacterium]|nr:pitrilysin family protein [Candidatus Omnitrophota bacterium]
MNKAISRIITINLALGFILLSSINAAGDQSVYTDRNTQKHMMDNGMTVLLHETDKSPIVSIDILVKCGSSSEVRYAGSGISHLVEHLLFKSGNEKEMDITSKEIKSLGGTMNGFTTRDFTVYTVVVPKDALRDALAILKKFIFFPSFDALEIDKEKEVIRDEIRRGEDDPASFISNLSWSSAFQVHPYKYPVIGYDDLFMTLTKADVEDYYLHHYSPDNTIIAISGDINAEAAFKETEGIFSGVKRTFVAVRPEATEPPQFSRRSTVRPRDMKLSHGAISYRSASIDDASLYALDVLAIILGQGEGSILTKELRDTKRLAYAVSCYNGTLRDSGLFYISFVADPAKADSAIDAILKITESIKENGISGEDLEKAKKTAKFDFLESLQTAEGRALDLITSEALTNDYLFSGDYLDKISAVTDDDIKKAAETYLDKSKVNTILLIPKQNISTVPAQSAREKKTGSRDISSHVMPNGMRVIICEDHSLPICTMSALFLGGVRFETRNNNGISSLTAALMLDGTSERKEEDIKAAVESMGGNISSMSGANSFGVTLNVMSSDWKKGFEIMSDAVQHSTFDNSKIEKEKTLTLAGIKERDDNIVRSGLLLLKENFFRGNPYSMDPLGQEDSIQHISREDILKFYESYTSPSYMVLAVTGDINKDDFLEEAKKRFGSDKRIDVKFPEIPGRNGLQKQEEVTGSMEREQSILLLGFPAVKITDNDRYTFEVIDSIMSGSDGRLFNDVRSSMGISYSLGSFFVPGIEPGSHIFYAVTTS